MDELIENCAALWHESNEKKVIEILKHGKTGQKLPREEYHILNTYNVVSLADVEKVKKKNGKYMATKEGVLDIVQKAHTESGHSGEKKNYKKIADQYTNIPRSLVGYFIAHCERCAEKQRRHETKAGVIVKPLSVKDLNERGQVDLVDLQTMKDGSYRYIMHYVEYLTKFHFLRPLKSKTASEVAYELLLIFLDIGAPHVLQSDNRREFTANIMTMTMTMTNRFFFQTCLSI